MTLGEIQMRFWRKRFPLVTRSEYEDNLRGLTEHLREMEERLSAEKTHEDQVRSY